ncbi:hypothetical protein P4S64_08060 [Vibrio sp. M60_M31a]
MGIRDNIAALEQQIYVACSEGDYDTVNMLEHQLEYFARQSGFILLTMTPYALGHSVRVGR